MLPWCKERAATEAAIPNRRGAGTLTGDARTAGISTQVDPRRLPMMSRARACSQCHGPRARAYKRKVAPGFRGRDCADWVERAGFPSYILH